MDQHNQTIAQKLKENVQEQHPDKATSPSAVLSEVATTKTPDQKAEIAEELFPHTRRARSMRTRRVMH